MICSKCGENVDVDLFDSVAYCPKCGNKIDYNRCSEECKDTFFDNSRILNDNDLYCKYCGAKSTYHVQGILKEN